MIIGGYVTTYTDVAAVLADVPPIEHLIMERLDAKGNRY